MPNNFTENRRVKFGKQNVGDGYPCFIVYEAGPTHDGYETAKKLVFNAAKSGAKCD